MSRAIPTAIKSQYARPNNIDGYPQSKPEGRTARLIRETKELWRRVVGCARHPRVEIAVLSEDSLFSQVRVSSQTRRCMTVCQT